MLLLFATFEFATVVYLTPYWPAGGLPGIKGGQAVPDKIVSDLPKSEVEVLAAIELKIYEN